VTENNFPYTAFNVAVPVSDAAYTEGDVSYIRPASTLPYIKEPVDVFTLNVKTSYRNRQSVGLQLSRDPQAEGSKGLKRDIHT
jgi:hypothetical protein